MKKFISLFLVLCLCLSLFAACGDKSDKDSSIADAAKPDSGSTSEPDPNPNTEATPEPSPESTPEPEPTPEPVTDEDTENLVGSVSENTYRNIYLNVTCTLDESWMFVGQQELAAMSGIAADLLEEGELKQMLQESDSFFDMYAISSDGSMNINITMEKVGLAASIAMSEEALANAAVELLSEVMPSAGYEDIECSSKVYEFCGKDRWGVALSGTMMEMPIYQAQVYYIVGGYTATITFTSYGVDAIAEMMDLFTKIGV